MLPKSIMKIESKNNITQNIFLFIRKYYENAKNIIFEIESYLRVIGITSNKYKKIKELKDIHKGKRCFIIATGPSLTMEDVEKLKNEYTFSMNSMCLALENTEWKPTYYGIQDLAVYEKLKDSIINSNMKNVFVGSSILSKYKIPDKYIVFPLNISYHAFDLRFKMKYFAKFSDNSYRAVYDGYTITYSLIQIATYMGFEEIYLIGADTNYQANKPQHFIEHGNLDKTFDTAKDRMIIAYEKAKEFADAKGIKIYNCTRGGMLEVFPRINLDDIIKNNNLDGR